MLNITPRTTTILLAALFTLPAAAVPASAQEAALLQGQVWSFGSTVINPTAEAADINADGIVDLVCVGNLAFVRLGLPQGGYAPPSAAGTGPELYSGPLKLVDLSQDGLPDLAGCGYSTISNKSGLVVALNNGSSAFGATVLTPLGAASTTAYGHIAYADFDGDGDLDAVGSKSTYLPTTTSLVVLRNNGAGPFTIAFTSFPGTTALDVGDFNQDSKPDVIASKSGSGVSFFRGLGACQLDAATSILLPVTVSQIRSCDLNLDGKLDIAGTGQGYIGGSFNSGMFTAIGDGQGGMIYGSSLVFAGSLSRPEVRDLNGDLLPDMALARNSESRIAILLQLASGGFSLSEQLGVVGLGGVQLVDLDANGTADVVASKTSSGGPATFWNSGSGTFPGLSRYSLPGGFATKMTSRGDLNSDGHSDLLTMNSTDPPLVLLGSGTGALAPAFGYFGLFPSRDDLVVADMDGDGDLDVLLAIATGIGTSGIELVAGDGAANFASSAFIPLPSQKVPSALAVDDLNGDGMPDVAFTLNTTIGNPGLIRYLNNGSGVPNALGLLTITGGNPLGNLAIGHATADSIPDLVVGDTLLGATIRPGTGHGSFGAPIPTGLGSGGSFVMLSDWNTDQIIDIVASLSTQAKVAPGLPGGGFGAFSAVTTFTGSLGYLTQTDFNGDGLEDLVACTHQGTEGVGFALASTPGSWGSLTMLLTCQGSASQVCFPDLDEDGRPDIVVTDGGVSVHLARWNSPAGVLRYGTGTSGCAGRVTLTASEPPKVGAGGFSLLSAHGPALALGLVVISDAADFAGSSPIGLPLVFHWDPVASTQVLTLDARTDVDGVARVALPIPSSAALAGQQFFAQEYWVESSSAGQLCATSTFGILSSRGLSITIQP